MNALVSVQSRISFGGETWSAAIREGKRAGSGLAEMVRHPRVASISRGKPGTTQCKSNIVCVTCCGFFYARGGGETHTTLGLLLFDTPSPRIATPDLLFFDSGRPLSSGGRTPGEEAIEESLSWGRTRQAVSGWFVPIKTPCRRI